SSSRQGARSDNLSARRSVMLAQARAFDGGAPVAKRRPMLRQLSAGAGLALCAGCGARDALDSTFECKPLEITHVQECARLDPDALPIARLASAPGSDPFEGVDGFHLASDGESLYFASEGRIFRVSVRGGAPEPLTPPDSGGSHLQFADGFVYWRGHAAVMRVSAHGGAVESLVELPKGTQWAVAPDAILSWTFPGPSPLYRTSFSTGETTEV